MSSEIAVAGRDDSVDAIVVERLTKSYRTYTKPRHRLLELLYGGRRTFHNKVNALSEVSFRLRRGGRLGIVGENGSGKSTLLKVLAGVLTPTTGHVRVNGRVSALLELGAGFNSELTGRENIAQFCMLHGLHTDEMRRATPAIIAFSELGDAIDHPVKTYSSGMAVRLGFSCAVYVEPDILIVDEALSVGDAYFQNKCLHKIKSLLDNGATFIYVTHAADSVRSLCEEGLWLDHGEVVMNDSAAKVGRAYESMIFKKLSGAGLNKRSKAHSIRAKAIASPSERGVVAATPTHSATSFESRVAPLRTGSGEIRIVDMVLVDQEGSDTDVIDFDRSHLIRVVIEVENEVPPRTALAVGVTDQSGRQLVHINSLDHEIDLHDFRPGAQEVIELSYHCPLCPGEYGLIAGVATMTDNPTRKKQLLIESVVDYCVGGTRFSIRYPTNEEGRDLWGLVAVKATVQAYSSN